MFYFYLSGKTCGGVEMSGEDYCGPYSQRLSIEQIKHIDTNCIEFGAYYAEFDEDGMGQKCLVLSGLYPVEGEKEGVYPVKWICEGAEKFENDTDDKKDKA